jgi:hypothetical protein
VEKLELETETTTESSVPLPKTPPPTDEATALSTDEKEADNSK